MTTERPDFPWELLSAQTLARVVRDLRIKYFGITRDQSEGILRVVEFDGLDVAYAIRGRVLSMRRRGSVSRSSSRRRLSGTDGEESEYTDHETDYGMIFESDVGEEPRADVEAQEASQLVEPPPPPRRPGRPIGSRNKSKLPPSAKREREQDGDTSLSAGEMTGVFAGVDSPSPVKRGPSPGVRPILQSPDNEAAEVDELMADLEDLVQPASPVKRERGRLHPQPATSIFRLPEDNDELAGFLEPTPSRKRGRPPGIRSRQISRGEPALSIATSRNRGRPPKNPRLSDVGPGPAAGSTPKRAPGRPRKERAEEAPAPKRELRRPRSRGPRTSDVIAASGKYQADAKFSAPPRLKVGRPARFIPFVVKDDEIAVAGPGFSGALIVESSQKRGPGRPRKNPPPVEATLAPVAYPAVSGPEESPSRRKPGRPPGKRPRPSDGLNFAGSSAHSLGAIGPPRKRGRPSAPHSSTVLQSAEIIAQPEAVLDDVKSQRSRSTSRPASVSLMMGSVKFGPPRKKRGRPPGIPQNDIDEDTLGTSRQGGAKLQAPQFSPRRTASSPLRGSKGKAVDDSDSSGSDEPAQGNEIEQETDFNGGAFMNVDTPRVEGNDGNVGTAAAASGSRYSQMYRTPMRNETRTDVFSGLANTMPWPAAKIVKTRYGGRRRSLGP